MREKWLKYGIVSMTAIAVLTSPTFLNSHNTYAASNTVKPVAVVKSVKLSGKSMLTLNDAQFLVQEAGKVLSFNVTISNPDLKSLNLMDYWMYVKTTSGKKFTTKMIEADKAKRFVPAKSSATLTFYAVVDDNTQLSGLQFQVIKWDFSSKSFEKSLGLIKPPFSFVDRVPAFKDRTMVYENTKLKASFKTTTVTRDETYAYFNMNFTVENAGAKSTKLASLKFNLISSDQSMYDVDSGDLSQITIQPKDKKVLTLKATVPLDVASKPMSLVVSRFDDATKVGLALGTFLIANSKPPAPSKLESTVSYENYAINIASLQRLPLGDNDLLTADILITNTSKQYQKIPNISGNFLVNGVKVTQVDKVNLDAKINLAPNESYNIVIYSKIPYLTSINNVSIVLNENISDTETRVVHEFTGDQVGETPLYRLDRAYEVSAEGSRSQFKWTKYGLYKNGMFYGELEYENKEGRPALPVNLGGYLTNKSGLSVPLNISSYREKILAGGKVVLSVWSQVPDSFEKEGLKIVFGQALASTTPALPSTPPSTPPASGTAAADTPKENILYKTVAYTVPTEGLASTLTDFNQIKYANYLLTLKNIFVNVNVNGNDIDGILMNLNYDLGKDVDIPPTAESHKLVLELVNMDQNQVTVSKEFEFDILPGTKDVLKEGTGFAKTIVMKQEDMGSKILQYNKYTLNVYDKFANNQVLLASKQLRWFMTE